MKVVMLGAALFLCATTVTSAASAQKGGRGGGRVRPMPPPPRVVAPPRRQALEQQFRQRSEQVVRDKLNLNDDQVARLRAVNVNIGRQRNALVQQERSVRSDLRDEMGKGAGADQGKVSQLMTQARELQGRRFALQQDEQQQLSGFMSPVQVAQYVGLQGQIRQRMREMRQGQIGEPAVPNP